MELICKGRAECWLKEVLLPVQKLHGLEGIVFLMQIPWVLFAILFCISALWLLFQIISGVFKCGRGGGKCTSRILAEIGTALQVTYGIIPLSWFSVVAFISVIFTVVDRNHWKIGLLVVTGALIVSHLLQICACWSMNVKIYDNVLLGRIPSLLKTYFAAKLCTIGFTCLYTLCVWLEVFDPLVIIGEHVFTSKNWMFGVISVTIEILLGILVVPVVHRFCQISNDGNSLEA